MISLQLTLDAMGADDLARLDPAEAALVAEVSGRDDTALITARTGGQLAGYAVFGWDADQIVTVYAARAFAGVVATAAMQGLFGASSVMGAPMRVHSDKVARGLAMARKMGAQVVVSGADLDGVPMAIFGMGGNGQ